MKVVEQASMPLKQWIFQWAMITLLFGCVLVGAGCNSGGSGGEDEEESNASFRITGAVTGSIASGVSVALSGSDTATITTDASGNFTFTVEPGTYTVTPFKNGCTFSPVNASVTVLGADVSGVDFAAAAIDDGDDAGDEDDTDAETHTLSGTVSGEITQGVTMTLSGADTGVATTDAAGNYAFTVASGSYTVSPSKTGYTFSPASELVSVSDTDMVGIDFVSAAEASGNGETRISLQGATATITGDGATVQGGIVTIASAGAYRISGTLSNGQIIVNTQDANTVRLIFNGAHIVCSTSAPVYIADAAQVILTLADGTENSVTDGTNYIFETADADEPNAVVFSKADLTIDGNGSLTVDGNYNDGIGVKDGLLIESGDITVTTADDGIRGKDYVIVKDGDITVTAGGDGVKSDNDEDAAKGYVSIETGMFFIVSAGDAIKAETSLIITDGDFNLLSGGGGSRQPDDVSSAKGLKGLASAVISGGVFSIDSADDAIHSNVSVTIKAGEFAISTGDDAVHADESITINGGTIAVDECYEGIESAVITINGGNIHINADDDGVNVAGGTDGSGMMGWPGRPDEFPASGNYYLTINGGYLVVSAAGDGIDVNGAIVMTGGDVIVNGPINNGNGALDYDRSFQLTGGFLLAVGSSGMAQAPDNSSTQFSKMLNLTSTRSAGTLVHVESASGEEIFTFSPAKSYQSIVFSSPEFAEGVTYNVYLGGSATGTVTDGLYQGGTYTPGTKLTSFTVPNS